MAKVKGGLGTSGYGSELGGPGSTGRVSTPEFSGGPLSAEANEVAIHINVYYEPEAIDDAVISIQELGTVSEQTKLPIQRMGDAMAQNHTHGTILNVTTQNLSRSIFQLNMSVLGMNMSLLGMMFNLKQSGMLSKEATDGLMKVVAPIQMIASVMGFAMSAYQGYIIITKFASVVHTSFATQVEINNAKMTSSNYRVFTSATMALGAMGGFAAVLGMFATKSVPARAALAALTWALWTYAAGTWAVTKGNIAMMASTPVVGWILVGVAIATIVAALAAIATLQSSTGLWKGGIVRSRTTATIGELGPEAVIPLHSPSGKNLLNGIGGSGGTTVINNYISADRPATLYRKTNQAVRRNKFLNG